MNSQKEAVFAAVTKFYGSKFENGMSHTKEDKSTIVDTLIEGVGTEFEVKNEQENMRSYIIGLLNNHLRKDTRLNGGEKYAPKNPGSRAGQGDSEIKASRQLLKTLVEGSPEAEKVKAFINSKLATIKAAKAVVEIDTEALPAELRSLVG